MLLRRRSAQDFSGNHEYLVRHFRYSLDCTQSLSFLVHSNWETGGKAARMMGSSARPSISLTPVSRAVAHLAHSSLSITKRKERDCMQSRYSSTPELLGKIYFHGVSIKILRATPPSITWFTLGWYLRRFRRHLEQVSEVGEVLQFSCTCDQGAIHRRAWSQSLALVGEKPC